MLVILFALFFLVCLVSVGMIVVGLALGAKGRADLRKIEKEHNLPPGSLDP